MKDIFKAMQERTCAVGGIKCPCCNMWKGHERAKLNRIARHKLKQRDAKEFNLN